MQQRLFDIGWSNECKCLACHKEEGTDNHRLYHCPGWNEVMRQNLRGPAGSGSKKAGTSKEERMWQRGIVTHSLYESQWNSAHLCMKKCESEKHKSWSTPADFKGHVATDDSLLGTAAVKWGACVWAVVQLD